MATTPTTSVNRTARNLTDPLRNFKFQVEITSPDTTIQGAIAEMGFTSVEGLNMSTEMIPYREGGWNTNPHKIPGMTDFSPVTLSSGVFAKKKGMWDVARRMFDVQWGGGGNAPTLGYSTDYRFDMLIRVFDHPVTSGYGSGARNSVEGAALAFKIYNAWVANVAYSGLSSMDNSILVSQMTVHHEGLAVFYGPEETKALRNTNTTYNPAYPMENA
jgi:phage tail-like protein